MILITGSTGNFGKATINFLLKRGVPANNIAALARDENKAVDFKSQGVKVIIGDYNDYNSLVKAFTGIDKVLLISGSDIPNRLKQQESAVKAAKEAGVKHIVYTSFVRKNETETSPIAFISSSHIGTEKSIKASGIPYTIMRNNLYAEVLPMFIGEKFIESGIFLPAGDGKASFASRKDMAEAAAAILAGEGRENKEYIIANNINYSISEVAAILSDIVKKEITYVSPSKEVYIETLTKHGVPVEISGMVAGFSGAIAQGEFETAHSDLETLIGRRPETLEEFLKTIYSANK
jgi:NAD(P)H dehydrogenase (quinone)